MFKNIVLLDRSGEFVESIIQRYNKINIILVAEHTVRVQHLLKVYKKNIVIFIDYDAPLEIQHTENIDYNLIYKMKFIQIDIETMLHRIMLNNPLAKDIYHQHLSYFAKLFKTYMIDLILCTEFNLATPNHLIPFGLGKLLGIPTYAIEHLPSCPAISINNYNLPERLILKENFADLTPELLVFYKHISLQKPPTTIKSKIERITGRLFIEFCRCIIKRSFKNTYLGIQYSFFQKLNSLFTLKKARRIYQRLSIAPNYDEKYIYYSIHFEPEATIIGKTTLESQLTMIKMLANAIPKDWKLFVKEHPHQFMLNTNLTHYFLHNITFFKNITFYQEIKKLKNVRLISLNTSTKDLIRHAQAVASINGTVALEAMLEKKYAILFSGKAGLYGVLQNILHISSYKDLQSAIEIIKCPSTFNPSEGFEKLKNFIMHTENPRFFHNLFTTIEEHAKTIQPTGEKL